MVFWVLLWATERVVEPATDRSIVEPIGIFRLLRASLDGSTARAEATVDRRVVLNERPYTYIGGSTKNICTIADVRIP